jgi:hypothetical protein
MLSEGRTLVEDEQVTTQHGKENFFDLVED